MTIKSWLFLALCVMAPFHSLFSQQQTLQEEQDFRFALQLENKGLYDLAALQFERFAETYPMSVKTPQALYASAQDYVKADSTARAVDMLRRILFKYPQSDILDQSQYYYAQLLQRNGETLQAALAFERIKILAPKSDLIPEAQIAAAENFLAAQQYQKALDAAAFILEYHRIHPARLRAYFVIAKVHESKGDYTQALAYVDRMLGDRMEDELAAQAFEKKSELLLKMGRYARSDSVLIKLVDGDYGGPIVARAAVKLAESLMAQQDYDEARAVLDRALEKANTAQKPRLFLASGDVFLQQKEWQKARDEYSRAAAVSDTLRPLYFFRLGFAARASGDFQTAVTNFAHVINDSSTSGDVRRYAAFEFAQSMAHLGRAVEAIRFLQQTAATVSPDLQTAFYLQIAGLQENYLQDYAGARQNYGAAVAADPTNELIDDAQYFYARTYDRQGDYDAAVAEYQRYLTYYPGGDFYPQVMQAIERIQPMPASTKQFAAADASSDIGSAAALGNAAQSRALYTLAHHYAYTIKDYARSLAFYIQAGQTGEGILDPAVLNRDLALCRFALYQRAREEKRPDEMQEHAQALADIANRIKSMPSSNLSENIEYWNVRANLPGLSDAQQRVDYLNNHISGFVHNDSLKNILQLLLVDEMLQAPADSMTVQYGNAISILDDVAESTDEHLQVAALYKKALLLNKMGFADSALTILQPVANMTETGDKPRSMMLLAKLYEKHGDYAAAERLYDQIADTYFYSTLARKAKIKLAALLLQQQKYLQAKRLVEKLQRRSVPPELRLFYPEKMDKESIWLWAKVVWRTQPPQAAMREFQNYLNMGLKTPHAAKALYIMGELAISLNKQDIALGFFEECAQQFPADSVGQQALIKTADLYFDRGQYERAAELYQGMSEKLTGDFQKEAFKNYIICHYKLGLVSRAGTLVKEFKKKYDDRNAEARFLYEEGVHYMSVKNLERAEKAFKTLSGKYDDVPEGARGELGLARLYVVQTKTEDALKRLTKIPQEYDDPEIVATAYLNLADFYYENRALENCITAGRQVLALQEGGQMRAQAIDLLINAYDDLGLRDQAVALERQYLEAYPHAEDALDRRIRIGTFLYYLKEYDRAVAHLKELAPIVPADEEARVRYWIAESYEAAGMTEQAIIEYLKVRYQCKQTRLPFGVTALYKAGEGYTKLNNLAKAREMFELVVKERGATDDFGRAANKKIKEIDAKLAGQS